MRLLGIELHEATVVEGLVIIWIGEILDWEIKRLPKKFRHWKIWAAGLVVEGIAEIESFK